MAMTTIGVVEDNAIVAEDIRIELERLGYRVTSVAGSYEDALRSAALNRPDLVLMDIMLAGARDGVAAAEEIRATLNIPVVFLTAHSDARTLERAKRTDPFGYVVKPFTPQDLRTTIEMALHRFHLEGRLRDNEAYLSTTLRSVGDGLIATDDAGAITFLNPVAERLTGWTPEDAHGRSITEVFVIKNPRTGEAVRCPVTRVLESGGTAGIESGTLLERRDGERLPIGDTAAEIRDDAGRRLGAVLVFQDQTAYSESQADLRRAKEEMEQAVRERTVQLAEANRQLRQHIRELQLAEERLQHQAYHDSTTGLPNRLLFQDRLDKALAAAKQQGGLLAVLIVDMKGFHVINEGLGHAAGDRLLMEASDRLSATLHSADTLARLGADQFAVLVMGLHDVNELIARILITREAFREPWVYLDEPQYVSVTIGAAVFPDDGRLADVLTESAESALRRAKAHGRSYEIHSPSLQQLAGERLELARRLPRALEQSQLSLNFQPQVSLSTGSIIGAEALVRWAEPDLGMIFPDRFISVAEETGMIVALGSWVLQSACSHMRAWIQAGVAPERVAVNISARQLQQTDFAESVRSLLSVTDLPAERLELEVTESALMQDMDLAVRHLSRLHDMGITIAMDDFGTGYSSLSYLQRLPIQTLKVDRSFVKDVIENAGDAAIVKAIVAMAKSLGLDLVAEGVETREQLDFLRALDCDAMQGYYFSKPLPTGEVLALFESGRGLS